MQMQQVEVGSVVEGKVMGITGFGAFVKLPDGKQGLVHISEVAIEYVKDIRDHLKENQIVKVKVMSVESNGKICLSIKKALEQQNKQSQKADKKNDNNSYPPAEAVFGSGGASLSFEERMSKFKTESDERISEFKKSIDSKRNGGYKRSSNSY